MEIGRNRSAAMTFASALSIAFLFSVLSSNALERRSGIWKVLRAGQFSGAMNEEAHVQPVKGFILANGKRYRFWEYNWTQHRTPGHGRDLLLVFEGDDDALVYLGSYSFDAYPFHGPVHPQIRGNAVFFPYKDIEIIGAKPYKEISFANGLPPEARIPGGTAFFR